MNIDWSTVFFMLGSVLITLGILSVLHSATEQLRRGIRDYFTTVKSLSTSGAEWQRMFRHDSEIEVLQRNLRLLMDHLHLETKEGMRIVKKTVPLLLALLALSLAGCYTWSDIAPYVPPVVINPPAPTNAVPPVVTNTPPAPVQVYQYIGNDLRDKAPAGGDQWTAFNGMSVRLAANSVGDLAKAGITYVKGSWYPVAGAVVPVGSITLATAPDGGIIVSCQDFVSTRSGTKYHCVGYFVQFTRDASCFRAGQSTQIPKAQCNETLRIMLGTVK